MNAIRLGIIGCGIAARDLHWPALQKLKNKFEIRAVCNHTEKKAREFSKLVGNVPYDLKYRDLLRRKDVEAVDIALPIHLNYSVTRDALAAGKHVFLEKPIAANLQQGKKMLKFDDKYPEVKMVAENFRYRPGLKMVKSYLDQAKIGAAYAVFWNYFNLVDSRNKYVDTKWRIHHQYPGGFITDVGVHSIAGLRYLFGDLYRLTAFTKSVNGAIGEMDSFSLQFKSTSGIHGVLNIFLSARGYSDNHILILGTEGSIRFENSRISIKRDAKEIINKLINNDNGYIEEFEDFYQAVRNGKKVASSFLEGYKDLEVIIKAINYSRKMN